MFYAAVDAATANAENKLPVAGSRSIYIILSFRLLCAFETCLEISIRILKSRNQLPVAGPHRVHMIIPVCVWYVFNFVVCVDSFLCLYVLRRPRRRRRQRPEAD